MAVCIKSYLLSVILKRDSMLHTFFLSADRMGTDADLCSETPYYRFPFGFYVLFKVIPVMEHLS